METSKTYLVVRSGKYLQWLREGRFCWVECRARATRLRSRDALDHSVRVLKERHGYDVKIEEECT